MSAPEEFIFATATPRGGGDFEVAYSSPLRSRVGLEWIKNPSIDDLQILVEGRATNEGFRLTSIHRNRLTNGSLQLLFSARVAQAAPAAKCPGCDGRGFYELFTTGKTPCEQCAGTGRTA